MNEIPLTTEPKAISKAKSEMEVKENQPQIDNTDKNKNEGINFPPNFS